MDRRDALKKLGMGGTTLVGASIVISSPAFADGGSATCRPSPAIANTLTPSVLGGSKERVRVTSSATTFTAATCGCGGWTRTVQRRWQLAGPTTTIGLYTATTGGTALSSGFSSPGTTVSVESPVYVRDSGGGHLAAGAYTVNLTVRHVCRQGAQVAWSCQRYRLAFSFATGGGSDGSLSSVSFTTIGPPDSTAACNDGLP